MPQITNFQVSLNGAAWVDLSSTFTVDNLPDRLPNDLAISNSLYNLFKCPIGARGRTFQPTYGCDLYYLLQEPIDVITATKIRIVLIQAVIKWEPRLKFIYEQCSVTPDYTIPGYTIRLAGVDTVSGLTMNVQFTQVV